MAPLRWRGERGLVGSVDGAAGANLSAGATLDALVGIDVVDFTFRNSFYGAYGQAGAAGHTTVSNYVSHNK